MHFRRARAFSSSRPKPAAIFTQFVGQLSRMTACADCHRREGIPVSILWAGTQFQFGGAGRFGPTARMGAGYNARGVIQQVGCGTTV